MGNGSWEAPIWTSHVDKVASKRVDEILTARRMDTDLDPHNFVVRESRDSDAHPQSTPVLFGADVTGSMGDISEVMIKKGIGIIQGKLLELRPITDPQLAVAAFGDVTAGDPAPIQMTQFESDTSIIDQMSKVWLVGHGGGNSSESDSLVLYMAAFRTSHDAYEKRGRKGYVFTCGDEQPPRGLTVEEIYTATGDRVQSDMSFADLIEAASRTFHVIHIIVEEGSHVRARGLSSVEKPWRDVLGQNVIVLSDINALGETVVSAIQVIEGDTIDAAAKTWSGNTGIVVRNAVSSLVAGKSGKSTGVATL